MFSSEKEILCGGESTIIVTCVLLSQSVLSCLMKYFQHIVAVQLFVTAIFVMCPLL